MSHDVAVGLVLFFALLGANLPFLSRRRFGVWPRPTPKSPSGHLLELIAFYGLVGAAGLGLEQYLGQIAPQGWEFYATTACLFLTLAFPGFVWRYLFQSRAH